MNQFSTEFEFNQSLLLFLGENCMNSKYGNFLSNSALESEKLKIEGMTIDIFNELDLTLIQYSNAFYIKPHDDASSQIMARDLQTMTCDLIIW